MLSATELGITEAEHSALQVVRDGLASGRFRHVSMLDAAGVVGECFNMGQTCSEQSCGTVACIGGWVAKTMGMNYVEADDYVNCGFSDTLHPLYYPAHLGWDGISADVAARAITMFLDSGDVDYPALIGVAR